MDLIPQGADILSQINNFIAESTRLAEALKAAENNLNEALKNNEMLKNEISQKEQNIEELTTAKDSLTASNIRKNKLLQEKEMKIIKATEAKELWRAKYQKTFRENNALKLKVKKLANPNKFIISKLKNFLQVGEETLTEISNIQSENFGSIRESLQSLVDDDDLNACDEEEYTSSNYMIVNKETSELTVTNKRVNDENENSSGSSIKKVKLADFIVESSSSEGTDNVSDKKKNDANKNTEHNENTTDEIISSNEKKDKALEKKLLADKIWNLFKSKENGESDSDQFVHVDDKEIDVDLFKRNKNSQPQNQMQTLNGVTAENYGKKDQENENRETTKIKDNDVQVFYDVDNSTDDDFELVSGYITQSAVTSTTKEDDSKDGSGPQVDVEATVDVVAKDMKSPRNKKEKHADKSKKVQISHIIEEINEKKETDLQNAIILEGDEDQVDQMMAATEIEDQCNEDENLRSGDGNEVGKVEEHADEQMEITNSDQNVENQEKNEPKDDEENINEKEIEQVNVSQSVVSHDSSTSNTNIENDANSKQELVIASEVSMNDDSKGKENADFLLDKENNQKPGKILDNSTPDLKTKKQPEILSQKNENTISEYRVTHKENPNTAENSFNETNSSMTSNKENGDLLKVRISFFYVHQFQENLKMTENQKHISRRKLNDDVKHERYCYLRVRNRLCFAKIMKNISKKFNIPLKKLRLFTLNNEIISPVALVQDVFQINKARRFIDVVSVEDPDDFIEGKILSSDQ